MGYSDEVIQRNVLEQLKWDARVAPNEIGVTVKGGVVTLVGSIDSYWKKWNAEEIALKVAGVKAVANELEVKLPSSAERTDADIARAIALTLEYAPDVSSSVKAVVNDGWVTLTGEVDWNYQREAAERRVRDVTGVKGVINKITLKATPRPQVEDIKHRIEQALLRTAETDAKNIQVITEDGRVILKGKVHSWNEKQEAKIEAWLAPGVRDVVDELQIVN